MRSAGNASAGVLLTAPRNSVLFDPRISLDGPKLPVRACPATPLVLGVVHGRGAYRGWWDGGYTGEGAIPGTHPAVSPMFHNGWVHRVPSRHSRPRLGPPHTCWLPHPYCLKWARFSLKYPKVSQNPRVSPEMCHEAWHSPCFKKRSIMHVLRFSDFRFGQPSLTRNVWSSF